MEYFVCTHGIGNWADCKECLSIIGEKFETPNSEAFLTIDDIKKAKKLLDSSEMTILANDWLSINTELYKLRMQNSRYQNALKLISTCDYGEVWTEKNENLWAENIALEALKEPE